MDAAPWMPLCLPCRSRHALPALGCIRGRRLPPLPCQQPYLPYHPPVQLQVASPHIQRSSVVNADGSVTDDPSEILLLSTVNPPVVPARCRFHRPQESPPLPCCSVLACCCTLCPALLLCAVRTSWGTFLQRGQDEVIYNVEHRLAAWMHVPVEHAGRSVLGRAWAREAGRQQGVARQGWRRKVLLDAAMACSDKPAPL
jgi:hypothetical protein